MKSYIYFLVFSSSFLFIALKSWQQLNVVKKQYAWIIPTSMLMAFVEVYIIAITARNGWNIYLVLAVGVGSGLGSLCATFLHTKLFKDS